jgi:hypothetical protein
MLASNTASKLAPPPLTLVRAVATGMALLGTDILRDLYAGL